MFACVFVKFVVCVCLYVFVYVMCLCVGCVLTCMDVCVCSF